MREENIVCHTYGRDRHGAQMSDEKKAFLSRCREPARFSPKELRNPLNSPAFHDLGKAIDTRGLQHGLDAAHMTEGTALHQFARGLGRALQSRLTNIQIIRWRESLIHWGPSRPPAGNPGFVALMLAIREAGGSFFVHGSDQIPITQGMVWWVSTFADAEYRTSVPDQKIYAFLTFRDR